MVKVIGKIKYHNRRGSFKVNENFKTEAQAQDFKRFVGSGGNVKVVRLRKKARRSYPMGIRPISIGRIF